MSGYDQLISFMSGYDQLISWMSGFMSKEKEKNAELREWLGLEPVSLVIEKVRVDCKLAWVC